MVESMSKDIDVVAIAYQRKVYRVLRQTNERHLIRIVGLEREEDGMAQIDFNHLFYVILIQSH